VPRRVAALLATPPVRRMSAVALSPTGVFTVLLVGLVTGSVWFSLDAATDLHRILEIAQLEQP
jgi:hypothetical protein